MTARSPAQGDFFGDADPPLPDGMRYQGEFITPHEEAQLLAFAQSLPLEEMNYRGFTARRRVMSYGGKYDFAANRLDEAVAIPPELDPLREKIGAWLCVDPHAFTHALVAEYREGTPLGWHRDVPDFEDVVGVSLLGEAVMRFRRYPPREPKKADVIRLVVQPRSVYLLHGPSRWDWQHSVAPTKSLRYSITFRTWRQRAAR